MEAAGAISLTPEESALFDFLLDVVAHNRLDTVLRVAGGWVRDKVLGKQSNDIDIALDNMTGIAFAELANARLAELGHATRSLGIIQANPEQSKHLETVALRVLGFELDLVNLRSETYAEGSRIPTVEFGSPLSDAMRRDLTINALFYNLATRSIEDLCGRGLADLKARVCRTPLEPRQTFLDDPLRVLRAVRFATRLGFSLAPELVRAARTPEVQEALRGKVSRERTLLEVAKMLTSPGPAGAPPGPAGVVPGGPIDAFRMLRSMGLLLAVFDVPAGCAHARATPAGAPAEAESARTGAAATAGAGEWLAVDERADEAWRLRFEDASMAAIEALDLVLGGAGPAAQQAEGVGGALAQSPPLVAVEPASDVRKLVWLAAALLPTRDLIVPFASGGKKPKPTPLAEACLRASFPGLSTGDIATVLRMLSSVTELASWCASADGPATLSRLQLGLRIREAGPLWPASLALALVAAAPPLDVASALPSTHDLDTTRIDAARRAWLQSATPHAAAAALLAARVDELGLADVHALRPLLSGAELMTEAAVPKGPAVGRASRALLEFQLAQPLATRAEAVEYLRANTPW